VSARLGPGPGPPDHRRRPDRSQRQRSLDRRHGRRYPPRGSRTGWSVSGAPGSPARSLRPPSRSRRSASSPGRGDDDLPGSSERMHVHWSFARAEEQDWPGEPMPGEGAEALALPFSRRRARDPTPGHRHHPHPAGQRAGQVGPAGRLVLHLPRHWPWQAAWAQLHHRHGDRATRPGPDPRPPPHGPDRRHRHWKSRTDRRTPHTPTTEPRSLSRQRQHRQPERWIEAEDPLR
jgi:hypothetical protein